MGTLRINETELETIKTKNMIYVSFFTALIAIGAFIRVPVPYCPFTLQLTCTTLAGMLLGAKLGALACGLYVILGLAGLPIFTQGGGPSYVLQPTFGYLIGFIIGAFLTGWVVHKGVLTMQRLLAGSFLGLIVVYAVGVAYYWVISRFWLGKSMSAWTLFLYCFFLPVPGDIALCFVSSALGKRLIPIMKRREVMA